MNSIRKRSVLRTVLALLPGTVLATAAPAPGQTRPASRPGGEAIVPPAAALLAAPTSELRVVVERYAADRSALLRRHSVEHSEDRRSRLAAFHEAWDARLAELDFAGLSQDGRVDWLLLRNRNRRELRLLDRRARALAEIEPLVPFAREILRLHDARRRMEPVDPAGAAATLARVAAEIAESRAALGGDAGAARPSAVLAHRCAELLGDLERTLDQWFRHHSGYHPLFTWWVSAPLRRAKDELAASAKLLRERIVGMAPGRDDPIIGDPLGRDALIEELAHELVPYTPEELVTIAEREFAWCEGEMLRAARDLGFGEDWKAALERVKTLHVEPGRQPELVRELAHEAIEFVEARGLVTVPPLAKEIWRIEMMTPERQKVSPFFLGGEVVQVAFPTDAMSHEDKLMSMRGNNRHFARATVHHELIPGHHLQGFMTERHQPHRRLFGTPFWTEGWALYWEMLFFDLGFPRTPEDRVGMLFWRMHRAARIVFSLGFHLGRMTPEECIDFLVDRVGHERANATAEVRRSFGGSYAPLYQAAYLLGGLQFRALRRELVESGKMQDREFHDAILQSNGMPVEMVRALLSGEPLARDHVASWRFADAGKAK
jgi:uncharacterized protein (DUF885 family)